MTKKIYAQPELTVVTIKRNDIVTSSPTTLDIGGAGSANDAEAPGRRFNIWYEGY